MTARVIQGFFIGGRPRMPGVMAQPRIHGPPAAAFAGRPLAVQRHGAGDAFAVDPGRLGLASFAGRPLPDGVRGKMEAALGADFSGVRVHVGPQAERIGAVAFTVGSDLYFAPGRYQPESAHGQQLLGHELAHVVQQRAGRVRNPFGSGVAVVQDDALEAEADRLGRHAAAYRIIAQPKRIPGAARPASSHRTGGIAVQRIKEITRTERIRWDYSKGNDDPQPVYGNVHDRWVSSFSASLTIDQNHGVITQAQQGGTWWIEGHSELFLEYLDPDQHPVMERIHYTHGMISIGAYSTTSADWRSRLPRGSSWRVNTQQIDDALDAARTLQRKFAKRKLEYSQWFGTTNWQSASKTNHVSMNCKDVTDAILIEAGVLHGRQAKIYSFNSPQNIAGHNNRNSVAPDHMWLD